MTKDPALPGLKFCALTVKHSISVIILKQYLNYIIVFIPNV